MSLWLRESIYTGSLSLRDAQLRDPRELARNNSLITARLDARRLYLNTCLEANQGHVRFAAGAADIVQPSHSIAKDDLTVADRSSDYWGGRQLQHTQPYSAALASDGLQDSDHPGNVSLRLNHLIKSELFL